MYMNQKERKGLEKDAKDSISHAGLQKKYFKIFPANEHIEK